MFVPDWFAAYWASLERADGTIRKHQRREVPMAATIVVDATRLVETRRRRLGLVLEGARRTPHYGGLLRDVVNDDPFATLSGLPPTDPRTIRSRSAEFYASSVHDRVVPHASSGTSGQRSHVAKPARALATSAGVIRRWLMGITTRRHPVVAVITPWSQERRCQWGFHDWRIRYAELGLRQYLESDPGARYDLLICAPDVAAAINAVKRDVTIATSFECSNAVLDYWRLSRYPHLPPLTPELYSSSQFTVPIANRFADCPTMHVNDDCVIVELFSPGEDVLAPPGTVGEIVVTDLLNTVMPLIRVRTGDAGVQVRGDCRCDRALSSVLPLGRVRRGDGPVDGRGHLEIVGPHDKRVVRLADQESGLAMTKFVEGVSCVPRFPAHDWVDQRVETRHERGRP